VRSVGPTAYAQWASVVAYICLTEPRVPVGKYNAECDVISIASFWHTGAWYEQ
jgi:hypothetical protein